MHFHEIKYFLLVQRHWVTVRAMALRGVVPALQAKVACFILINLRTLWLSGTHIHKKVIIQIALQSYLLLHVSTAYKQKVSQLRDSNLLPIHHSISYLPLVKLEAYSQLTQKFKSYISDKY